MVATEERKIGVIYTSEFRVPPGGDSVGVCPQATDHQTMPVWPHRCSDLPLSQSSIQCDSVRIPWCNSYYLGPFTTNLCTPASRTCGPGSGCGDQWAHCKLFHARDTQNRFSLGLELQEPMSHISLWNLIMVELKSRPQPCITEIYILLSSFIRVKWNLKSRLWKDCCVIFVFFFKFNIRPL